MPFYSFKVAGMMICYIMSGGKHPYGENSLEITVSIQANWPKVSSQQSLEISSLVIDMLAMPPADRPEFTDILKYGLPDITCRNSLYLFFNFS